MIVKSADTYKVNEIDNVCVVINELYEGQYHTGFFFKSLDGNVKFLHLEWYEKLTLESADENYKWLDIPFDKYNQMHFQLFLENIHRQNGSDVPYGIAIDGIDIGSDGKLLQKEKYSGLTCATFVLRALHSQGYKIIDIDNWNVRNEDSNWQETIITALDNYCKTSDEFIEKQKTYIGKVARYQPSEVVVAANAVKPPLAQDSIISLAKELIIKLKEN